MPVFKYKAVDSRGNPVEGIQNAASRDQVLEILRSRGDTPVRIDEYRESRDITFDFLRPGIQAQELAVFCRQFYTMLHTGIPIVSCLDILREQSESKTLKSAVNTLYEDIQTGMSLSESLRRLLNVFPDLFINMVEAGEVSGNLDAIMLRLALHYDSEARIKAKIGNAMIYPVILMAALVFVVIGLLTLVMPMFISLFINSGVALPLPTRALIAFSDSLTGGWYIYIAAVLILAYLYYKLSRTEVGGLFIDGIKLRLPFFGKPITKIITSRFIRTLSTLMSSGIPLMQALEITARVVDNRVIEEGILDAKEQVGRGVELSATVKSFGVFEPMVYSMIMVGEQSGALDDILEKTADFYDAQVESAMQALVAVFEPILIVFMALVVGFVVISIFLPLLDMMTTIQ